MTQELQKEFARRISVANRVELTVVVYDLIVECLNDCEKSFNGNDLDAFRHDIKKAQRFLCELMSTLDLSIPIGVTLLRLYEFVQRIVVKCDVSGTLEELDVAKRIIGRLRDSFAQITDEDKEGPVMTNTEPVYAGLTYGKGKLNETELPSGSRGFFA